MRERGAREYSLVLIVEVVVIAALVLLGRYFA